MTSDRSLKPASYATDTKQPKLPIMQPDLPTKAREKLGIFELNGQKYLMIVDYFSRFPVIRLLNDMTAHTVCNHFNSVLSEYGLPSTILADYGSQYVSSDFSNMCAKANIKEIQSDLSMKIIMA